MLPPYSYSGSNATFIVLQSHYMNFVHTQVCVDTVQYITLLSLILTLLDDFALYCVFSHVNSII